MAVDKTAAIGSSQPAYQRGLLYHFNCKREGCLNQIKVSPSKFKVVSGYCRWCAKKHKEPYMGAFNKLKDSAIRRNYEVTLTYEQYVEIIKDAECFYCGDDLNVPEYKYSASYIDRYNNKIGYTYENSVACCKLCNQAKHTLSSKQFINLCKEVANNHA